MAFGIGPEARALSSAAAPVMCVRRLSAASLWPLTTSNMASRTTDRTALAGLRAGLDIILAVFRRAMPYFCWAAVAISLSLVRLARPERPTAAMTSKRAGELIHFRVLSSEPDFGSWG